MTLGQIDREIGSCLDGAARECWVGMGRMDRVDVAVGVQAGVMSVAEAAEKIREWADVAPMEDGEGKA